jgi:hypothetical protein
MAVSISFVELENLELVYLSIEFYLYGRLEFLCIGKHHCGSILVV